MSCFRLSTLARLPSVMRLGSSKGLQGHLPAAATQGLRLDESYKSISDQIGIGNTSMTADIAPRAPKQSKPGKIAAAEQAEAVEIIRYLRHAHATAKGPAKAQQRRLICPSSMTRLI